MSRFLRRKLNNWALLATMAVVIVINSAGAGLDWWPASIFAVIPMLAVSFGVGWLFGKPIEEPQR